MPRAAAPAGAEGRAGRQGPKGSGHPAFPAPKTEGPGGPGQGRGGAGKGAEFPTQNRRFLDREQDVKMCPNVLFNDKQFSF